jgi:general secretion pathway protein C
LTVKTMWLKITQLLKEQTKEIRNMNASQLINSDLSRSFLILLAITVLSFEATDLFYKIISIPLTKQIIAVTSERISSSAESNQRRQLQDYSIVTERNLFLTTLKEAGGNDAGGIFDSEQKAPDFDLKGTVACNSSFGFIIVEERENRKQKLYRLGEKIGSRKLVKITRNTAVLKNEEGEVTLKIKETVEDSLLSNSPVAQRNSSSARIPSFVKKNMDGNLNHLESIMNQAVVRPFMNKGVREGYIISNIAPNSVYEKAGIQNGDVIIGINKNQMQNANDIMQLLNSMQSGSRMEFSIKRQGRTETINYTLE